MLFSSFWTRTKLILIAFIVPMLELNQNFWYWKTTAIVDWWIVYLVHQRLTLKYVYNLYTLLSLLQVASKLLIPIQRLNYITTAFHIIINCSINSTTVVVIWNIEIKSILIRNYNYCKILYSTNLLLKSYRMIILIYLVGE